MRLFYCTIYNIVVSTVAEGAMKIMYFINIANLVKILVVWGKVLDPLFNHTICV